MKGTFFFVHGTGVREPTTTQFWKVIQERAKANGFEGVTFTNCRWGDDRGADLSRIGDSLPAAAVKKSIGGEPTEAERAFALWTALLGDPLFELRVTAQGAPATSGPAIGAGSDRVKQANSLAVGVGDVTLDLKGTGLTQANIKEAAGKVAASPELAGATRTFEKGNDPTLVKAMARAIVAQVIAQQRAALLAAAQAKMPAGSKHVLPPPGAPEFVPQIAANAERRDELVRDIAAAMAPPTKSIGGWLMARGVDVLKPWVTDYLRAQRDPMTRAHVSGAADILFYQRRGDEIVSYLADALRTAGTKNPPLVAVAHSLGGELLADALSLDDAPKVDLLVTVGSQVSLFHAVDGLRSLRADTTKPPFAKWLNVYDRNDFLSYVAKPIFAGEGIEDIELSSGVPFPDAHGAYFHNDKLYQLMKERWPT